VSQIQRLRKNGQTRQIFYFFENNFKTRKKSLPGAMIISNIQIAHLPIFLSSLLGHKFSSPKQTWLNSLYRIAARAASAKNPERVSPWALA
jgi:hypothetical protein